MTIITCCGKEYNIPYSVDTETSQYIKDIVEFSNNVDITIPIDDKYCTVINNYIEYKRLRVNLKASNIFIGNSLPLPIIPRHRLLLSFQLDTLLIDDIYFKYLAGQTFNNWSIMCNIVYNDFNDDLQWSLFLLAPYDFIPKNLLNNNLFMSQWNNINQNKCIRVNNGSEWYYNNCERDDGQYQESIETYHTVNFGTKDGTYVKKEVGYKRQIMRFKYNNNYVHDISYIDGEKDGLWRFWYDNDQNRLESESYYVNDQLHGTSREWYDNEQHTLESESHYTNGERDGTWRQWYNNEQHSLMSEYSYVNGKSDGTTREWYDDYDHTLKFEGHYINGKAVGVWKEWYDNNQHSLERETYYVDDKMYGIQTTWYNNKSHSLKSEGPYINGKRDGRWRSWHDNEQHSLESEGYYVNDKRDGLWKFWYDNVHHTLKREAYYVNGTRHGHSIEFDRDGKVISDGEYIHGVKQ